MALPSDESNADSRLQVRFYKRPVQQEQESLAAGRPIFKAAKRQKRLGKMRLLCPASYRAGKAKSFRLKITIKS